jgi:hypothetical protein
MRSFERAALAACASLALALLAGPASAQTLAQGFAVDRFYPSAAGGGWFVMDDVNMRGGLGGAVSLSSGYAHDPLRVTDGVHHVNVVSDLSSLDFGVAVTYDRFRAYLDLQSPLLLKGDGGTAGAYRFTPPSVDLGSHPDTLSDARFGFDARVLGEPDAPFRLGVGVQLYVPSGTRGDYDTDSYVRAMARVLAAGDLAGLTYAAQLGVHVRPLDDSPTPGSPQGSELLFGAALGKRFLLGEGGKTALVVGPEVFGQTAFRSFFGTSSTGLEGLLTGRLEGTGLDGEQAQVKLGVGAGLDPRFGTPEWRFVLAFTLFDRRVPPSSP